MKFKVLNDLASDGIIHYYMTVFKSLFTNSDMRIVTCFIALLCAVGAFFAACVASKIAANIETQRIFAVLIIILTFIVFFIALCIYAVVIMLSNHYYGKYEADVKPVAVHNNKNVNGKWESRVTLEDKHKYKVKVKIHGHKLSKKDKINVATQKQFFNGREPEYKVIDYSGSQGLGFAKDYEPYNFTYKGHKMKVINHFR